MLNSNSGTNGAPNQLLLKVLLTEASIRQYTGEEDGYVART